VPAHNLSNLVAPGFLRTDYRPRSAALRSHAPAASIHIACTLTRLTLGFDCLGTVQPVFVSRKMGPEYYAFSAIASSSNAYEAQQQRATTHHDDESLLNFRHQHQHGSANNKCIPHTQMATQKPKTNSGVGGTRNGHPTYMDSRQSRVRVPSPNAGRAAQTEQKKNKHPPFSFFKTNHQPAAREGNSRL